MDWEFVVMRCKLLHLEWINKVLLYRTGSYIQSPGINYNGKEYLKEECMHVYNYFAVQQKLAQHCKSTILQLKNREK